jgi:hypothetical protein
MLCAGAAQNQKKNPGQTQELTHELVANLDAAQVISKAGDLLELRPRKTTPLRAT